jgi:VCBS repeat-containing protein
MAVTKQTYTATATVTGATFFTQLRSAFIDAGLMTEWHDSFLSSTVENRVLEITNAAGTYGKTYYWFVISATGEFRYQVATGWTAGSDVPSGTQYLDYFATTTNSVGNHKALITVTYATDVKITRYTSGDVNFFVISQGATYSCFTIVKGSGSFQPWVDFSKGFLNLLYEVSPAVSASWGQVGFNRFCSLRRELGRGIALNGSTTLADYTGTTASKTQGAEYAYCGLGNVSNNWTANAGTTAVTRSAIVLPIGFNGTNGAYSTNSSPVFHSLPYSQWITTTMGSDFGITMLYTANTLGIYDTITVSAGTEVWEVMAFTNNATITTGATPVMLARTT